VPPERHDASVAGGEAGARALERGEDDAALVRLVAVVEQVTGMVEPAADRRADIRAPP
jgi:hypothetical protein